METMYVLKWDFADTNTDTYGSQIKYQKDGNVYYQNELQPAGKKIHWWQSDYFGDSDPLQNSRYGSKRLPQISKSKQFSLIFHGEAFPQSSIGLNVKTFDKDGQLIRQKMTLSDKLDFQLTDEEPAYEISLVKFNNQKLKFQDLLMIPQSLVASHRIENHLSQHCIDVIPRTANNMTKGKIMVRQAHRVIDAIPISEPALNEPLRILSANDDWNANQLKQFEDDFIMKFKLQDVEWSASDLKAQALLNRK